MSDLARVGATPVARLTAFFVVEVVALTLIQAPNELFYRYAFGDSGTNLTIQDLICRGYRPTIDFGYIYGLLPLLVNRAWFAVAGATPRACWWATLACNVVLAWGLARFAVFQRVGRVGVALLAVAMPDLLRSSYDVLVQAMEPALLVHALAEQARGRRGRALALVTAAAFVKPSMAYVYGLFLLIAIAATIDPTRRDSWRRALGPAIVTGLALAGLLAAVYGVRPLINTLIPSGGIEVYRRSRFGFFHGQGRAFWFRPDAGLRGYLRYEIGYWLAGTFALIVGGLGSLRRIARGIPPVVAHNDEVVLGCAALHVAFVTLFFGHSFSWKYYLAIFLLGLAAMSTRGRRHAIVVGVITLMVLITDRAWAQALVRDWKTTAPGATTLGLWAPLEARREWAHVLELTRGRRPALMAECEGAALLYPQFAPPMGTYFVPGHPTPPEIRRKAAQLSDAPMIVLLGHRDDRRFAHWPELIAPLGGCELLWGGRHYQVYRQRRGDVDSSPRVEPPEEPDDAEGVVDPAVSDQPGDRSGVDEIDDDFLVGVEVRLGDTSGVVDHDGRDPRGQERRVRPDGAEKYGGIAGIAGLFEQLACAGVARILARFEQAAGEFEAVAHRPGAELPDQHQAVIGRDRDRMHGVGQVHHVIIMGPAGEPRPESLATQAEQPVLLDRHVQRIVVRAGPGRLGPGCGTVGTGCVRGLAHSVGLPRGQGRIRRAGPDRRAGRRRRCRGRR